MHGNDLDQLRDLLVYKHVHLPSSLILDDTRFLQDPSVVSIVKTRTHSLGLAQADSILTSASHAPLLLSPHSALAPTAHS
jgi:hypothetical protein